MAKITTLPTAKAFYPKDLKKPSRLSDNNGGGEPPMDNKYVTHQELELSNEKLLHHMDNKFAEMQQQMNQQFNEVDKHFNDLELKVNDIKNTANNNKEKINWLLYTAIGGIIISVITTIISNLLTK
ncbi:putative protein [Lactobacillus prophage Lj928]|uniref:Lj928 prophage protein n=1 Tax=Lactobacillus johnsonii (strain CNCM I-12250 / La1 / NCC 533) TaxID=257314 RepID=Q65PM5_LACJO|nr:hypothetical protein [Lactobacillus johnsonii]NP_958508.1 hypothetical protein Ljo_1463 [Lactobacillus prophage Lj928]AAR27349.1 putative protein [Lactobacillus prophage Lj928]AAS09231.1 Lj928 prophage protein [Lactobacillus prophage Lj928] [Lactobacillus johnsonii NCC 533]MCT3321301.1 hypothetical protein [Lactobacillus johnsonii]MCT3340128.1 hypothetical protein [Lactobacillus johnsonii]MCT3389740.1 hypothetical protein [Lactobacillus johnsonii]